MTAGKLTLRPDQAYRVQRILAEPTRAALLGDEMGRGKTAVAVEVALQGDFQRVLVVGVKDTYHQFAECFTAQSDGQVELRRIDSTKKGRAAFDALMAGEDGFFFAGVQYLATQDWTRVRALDEYGQPAWMKDKQTLEMVLEDAPEGQIGPRILPKPLMKSKHKGVYRKMRPLDLMVSDEVHLVASRKSNGRRTFGSIKVGFKLGMSGSWYRNAFENAWSVASWLWPDLPGVDRGFIMFKKQWCATETIRAKGGREVEAVTGEKNPGAFAAHLPCYIRSEADEKPPAPIIMQVDLSPAQREQYDALERDMLVWLDDQAEKGQSPLIADVPITLRTRLRTAALGEMSFDAEGQVSFAEDCESSKLAALGWVLREKWAGKQVAVYTHSRKFAEVVTARLLRAGFKAALWSGGVSSKERDRIKAQFLAGEITHLVAVIAAFSTGLDGFQKVCNRVVWLSESDDLTDNSQAIARFFRPGRIPDAPGDRFEHVKIHARGTHDEGIYSRHVQNRLLSNAQMRAPEAA